jgi:hypothetical protein
MIVDKLIADRITSGLPTIRLELGLLFSGVRFW